MYLFDFFKDLVKDTDFLQCNTDHTPKSSLTKQYRAMRKGSDVSKKYKATLFIKKNQLKQAAAKNKRKHGVFK